MSHRQTRLERAGHQLPLREFDGRDRPLSNVAFGRDS
jgi:hypothetical protein